VPVKIDPATAVATREQIGSPMAGWFQFQPMLASIILDGLINKCLVSSLETAGFAASVDAAKWV